MKNPELILKLLEQLGIQEVKPERKQHDFWNTQPVPQTAEELESLEMDGPIYDEATIKEIREQPVNLPSGNLQWCTIDIEDEVQLKELYLLLNQNYVEDTQSSFRFDYQPAFLRWALQPPGAQPAWLVGVRDEHDELVAFIAATPVHLAVRMHRLEAVEVNFLCLHKQLRSKRMAPLLIQEVTRRVYQQGIYQALYTAGITLPEPIARCQYYHRPLNYPRLVETGFSAPPLNGKSVDHFSRFFDLGKRVSLSGWREMVASDVPAVHKLLSEYLQQSCPLRPLFSEEEVKHWLLPREHVMHSFVVSDSDGEITDFISYYSLPSTVVTNATPDHLKVAYLFYYACRDTSRLEQLVRDALVTARDAGYDVFNCVESMANQKFLNGLRFQPGDGYLHYYLFNWRTKPLQVDQVGVTML